MKSEEEKEEQQSEAKTFFGIKNLQQQQSRRVFRRDVWSSSVQEENRWLEFLLSQYSNQRHGRDADRNLPLREDGKSYMSYSNIPKIIHFIWLGENSMPTFPLLCDDTLTSFEWNECIESWKLHHPPSKGWEIVVWAEKNIIDDYDGVEGVSGSNDSTKKFELKQSQMRNKDAYRQAIKMKNYGAASDILRLDILNEFGGVYSDIDYFCVGCLDDIMLSGQVQFFCCASNTGCVEINNGLIACQKGGHHIVTKMIESIHYYFDNKLSNGTKQDAAISMLSSFLDATTLSALETSQTNSSEILSPMEVIEHTGPGLLTRLVCRWLVANGGEEHSASQVIIFPFHVFHPLGNNLRNKLLTKAFLKSFIVPNETKAVHLWGCSWQQGN